MNTSCIHPTWPWPRSTPQNATAEANLPSGADNTAHDVFVTQPSGPSPHAPGRHNALQTCLLTALEIAQKPDTVLADQVVVRFEALRHWVPRFKTWARRPRRAEAFFQKVAWPPMDPVAAGVLVGLTYRARSIALQDSPTGARGTRRRLALAAATQRGMLSVPGLQPYASVIQHVGERETRQKCPADAANFAVRTGCALMYGAGAESPASATMRQVANDVYGYSTVGLRYGKVRATPAPVTLKSDLPPLLDAARIEALQSHVVSFVHYHNREETGRDIVGALRELIQNGAAAPQSLIDLPLAPPGMSLQSNFLAGALVGTFYLGLFHGMQDLHGKAWHGPSAQTIALCKHASDQLHVSMGKLVCAIPPAQWDQMAFIVRTSLDAGVSIKEIRARLMAYVESATQAIKRNGASSSIDAGLREQLEGVEWRLSRYPVIKL